MSPKVFFLALSLIVCLVNAGHPFYPDWSNCEDTPQLEFIDFYLDHQPNPKHAVNTITFCVGQGRDKKFGKIGVKVESSNPGNAMDENYPSLEGFKFANGMYDHCLQGGMLEFIDEGDYNLTLNIYANNNDTLVIGCLKANWSITSDYIAI